MTGSAAGQDAGAAAGEAEVSDRYGFGSGPAFAYTHCLTCGAVIHDEIKHAAWHDDLANVLIMIGEGR